jgi:DNA-binding MarR family transcriptional regulator
VTFTTNAGKPAPRPADAGRDTLIAELVDEMTSWSARDRMNAFKSWLKGSLSLIHLHVLTILEAEGPIPMSKLADTLDVSVASTTGIIGRMEERGLVERSHGEADRRVVLVQATAAGKAIFLDMTDQRRVALTALLGKLADDELAALLIGLRAMRTARAALHSEMAGVEAAGTAAAPGATVPSARPTKTLPAKEVRP